jgi:hypothetical protein
MQNITENIRIPDLDEVKVYAQKMRKNAEDNATALIILLLVVIAFIGLIQIILSVKKIRELKKLRRTCRTISEKPVCYCEDCEELE